MITTLLTILFTSLLIWTEIRFPNSRFGYKSLLLKVMLALICWELAQVSSASFSESLG